MSTTLAFIRAKNVYATGLGVKRNDHDWQYYLPFTEDAYYADRFAAAHDSHVKFAKVLVDGRVMAASGYGELVLIDVEADAIIARADYDADLDDIFLSVDNRTLLLVAGGRRIAVDLKTFARLPQADADGFSIVEADRAMKDGYLFSRAPEQSPAFEEVVARETMIPLVVTDDSLNASIAAIEELADRMERDLNALKRCGSIQVRFVLSGKKLDGEAFFNRLVENNWTEAAPAQHRLMMAYLNNNEGGEGCMPWEYSG